MKFLVVSDIHGSYSSAERCVALFEKTQADRLILLGDYLYHGPRNPLPKDYDPKRAAAVLNGLKNEILAVRGNCDSEVDQMLLEFPMMSEALMVVNEGQMIYLTHGHRVSPDALPDILHEGDVFLYGHVHLPIAEKQNGRFVLNPGSITLPKQENPQSYGILTESGFTIVDLDDQIIKQIDFSK